MPSETASFGGLFMSLFAFAPFPLRLEFPAVVRRLRPVQLPFLVLLLGDFTAAELLLPEHPLDHEAVQDVVIEAERNALAGKRFIRVIHRLNQVHPWVQVVQLKQRMKNPAGVCHRRVGQVFAADIQRGGNPLQKLVLGLSGIVFVLGNPHIGAVFVEADSHAQLLHRHFSEIAYPFDPISNCHARDPPVVFTTEIQYSTGFERLQEFLNKKVRKLASKPLAKQINLVYNAIGD